MEMMCFGKVTGEWYLCGDSFYLSIKVFISGETILLPTWAKNSELVQEFALFYQ